MTTARATVADTWALAWTAALAFSGDSTTTWLRTRAAFNYPRHWVSLLPAALAGNLWHNSRQLAITIEKPEAGNRRRVKMAAGILLTATICAALLAAVNGMNLEQLLAVLDAMQAFLIVCLFVVVLCLVEIVRSEPGRLLRAAAAIKEWKHRHGIAAPYKVSYLVKHPDAPMGEGLRFARAALRAAVPSGEALCTVARSKRHVRAYQALGMNQLDLNNEPTAGMAGTMP